MPDIITPADRDLIDAFPRNRVQIIPTGVSAIDPWAAIPLRAQIRAGFDFGKRVKSGMASAKAQRDAGKDPLALLPGEPIDAAIARLKSQNRTLREIAAVVGMSAAAVHKRLGRIAA